MPQPSDEQIRQFLETLGNLLGEHVSFPEFGDLFEGGDTPMDTNRPVLAAPDEIETAVVIGLQRAEIAQHELAEAKRVQAQWEIAESLGQRNDNPPPRPEAKALEIVEPARLPDHGGLSDAAELAVRKLVSARGEPDEIFEKATAEAIDALDKRDAAFAKLKEELDAELKRRRDVIEDVKRELAEARKPVTGILAEAVASSKPPPSVKPLKAQLELADQQVNGLPGLVETALPGGFDGAIGSARQAIAPIGEKIAATTDFVLGKVQQDRASLLAHLPKTAPMLRKDAAPLVDASLLKAAEVTAGAWETANKDLLKLPRTAPDETFQTLYEGCVTAYETAQEDVDKVDTAARDELNRRGLRVEELRNAGQKIAEPQNLLAGTQEHTNYTEARKTFREALSQLDKTQGSATVEAFKQADSDLTRRAVDLTEIARQAGEQAGQRVERTTKLVEETRRKLIGEAKGLAAVVKTYAIPGVTRQVNIVLKNAVGELEKIKGIDDKADGVIVEKLARIGENAKALEETLKNVPFANYTAVNDNVDMAETLSGFLERLKMAGIDKEAVELAGNITKKANRIKEKYDVLDSLEPLIATSLLDRRFAPNFGKILDGYPDVKRDRKTLDAGKLQEEINKFKNAMSEIDYLKSEHDDKADETGRPDYDASDCKTFIDNWNVGSPTIRLQNLVANGKVRVATKLKAYQANDDKPSRFSVEANIRIDGHTRIVGVSYELTNTLRTALLPPKRRCYEAGKSAGFVS